MWKHKPDACLVFFILLFSACSLLISSELLAQDTKPAEKISVADPNEVQKDESKIDADPEPRSGESTDVTELLAEDKKIIKGQEDRASLKHSDDSEPNDVLTSGTIKEAVAAPSDVAPKTPISADPNLLAGGKENQDVAELLSESKEQSFTERFGEEVVNKLLTPYTNSKKYLHDRWYLDTAMEHVIIYQRATGGRRPREQATYNFTYFGVWDLSKLAEDDIGVLGFSFEQRSNVTDHSVGEFSEEVGTNYRTHGMNTNDRNRTALRQLWWRKAFFEKALTVTAGKIHHSSYYNRNAFAGNPRTFFFGNPFSRNPNRPIPQDGLGVNVTIKPNDKYYFSVGFGDAEAKNTTSGFNTIEDGHLFTAAEFGLTPMIEGAGRGNYRFTFWNTNKADQDDVTDESKDGFGIALSFDQEVNKNIGLFARYGYTEPQVTNIRNFASGGFVWHNPWQIEGDLMGIGLSWDQPSDGKDDEYSIEVFHRVQLTSNMQLTPSIQVIFDPSQSDKSDPVAVFGFRFRSLF